MATKKAKSRGPAKRRVQENDVTDLYLVPKPKEMEIRPFKWTAKQQSVINTALDKNTKIVMIRACAGTGKTLLSMFCGLTLLKERDLGSLIYLRNPVESSSAKMGFLPGSYEEKIAAYGEPAIGVMKEMISTQDIKVLQDSGKFECQSVGFVKGLSYHNKIVVIDECEDFQISDLKLCGSRVGRGSVMFFIGDASQSNVKNNGFDRFFDLFNDEESRNHGVHCFEFGPEDCMRSGITRYILGKSEGLR